MKGADSAGSHRSLQGVRLSQNTIAETVSSRGPTNHHETVSKLHQTPVSTDFSGLLVAIPPAARSLPPGLRLPQAKLSRNSNQIARGRIRQFESYMPSQAVRSQYASVAIPSRGRASSEWDHERAGVGDRAGDLLSAAAASVPTSSGRIPRSQMRPVGARRSSPYSWHPAHRLRNMPSPAAAKSGLISWKSA
jgi:hypothetical protein